MLSDARDCRTCRHNGYGDNPKIVDWVVCVHPVTLAKMPKWQYGDPEWVNAATGDRPVSRIAEVANCPAWEAKDVG